MGIKRLSGYEKMHDLAGPFKDRVYPGVAHRPFYGKSGVAPAFQRGPCLVTPACPDLEGLIHNLPALFRAEEFRYSGLHTYIQSLVIRHVRYKPRHRIHGKDRGRYRGDL